MIFLRILYILVSVFVVNKVCTLVWAMPVATTVEQCDCNDRSTPSTECGAKVAEWHNKRKATGGHKENCEEACSVNYLEGDILLPPNSSTNIFGETGLRVTLYNALDPAYYNMWSNTVPYVYNASISDTQKTLIKSAMDTIAAAVGCMSFVARTTETDYLVFGNTPTGCWSNLGRQGGAQIVNLQFPGCTVLIGTAMHEIMHALGFMHEQTRPDRDSWVNIIWSNIIPGAEPNFNFLTNVYITNYTASYDFESVMHYSQYAFTSNGFKTIVPIPATTAIIGQRTKLSVNDTMRLKRYFNCYP